MLTESAGTQGKLHACILLEDLVGQDEFLRKVDKLIDFSFIYDEVRDLYCQNNGRPSVDPVVLVKYLLVGFLDGITSEREIERRVRRDLVYRWFLRLELDGRVPDHSTISQLRRRKFNGSDLFRKIFERVLAMCIEKGLVEGKLLLTDSTHIKANASKTSEIKIMVEKEAGAYWSRLDVYEKAERARLKMEKKARKQAGKVPKTVEKTTSKTDPNAGILNRPGKPGGFHYLDHQTIDAKCGIIVDAFATAGNTPDCAPFLDRIEHIEDDLGLKIEAVAVDSAYDNSLVHQELEMRKIEIFTPQKALSAFSKVEFAREAFAYDQALDAFVCPNGETLKLRCLQRTESGIFREYRAEPKACRACPYRKKCLAPSQRARKIQVNIFEKAVKRHHARDGSPEYRHALKMRQIWCEGTFAAQKARHNLRQIFRRGIEAAQTHCLLSATAINLKRLAKCLA
jgi:transposase